VPATKIKPIAKAAFLRESSFFYICGGRLCCKAAGQKLRHTGSLPEKTSAFSIQEKNLWGFETRSRKNLAYFSYMTYMQIKIL